MDNQVSAPGTHPCPGCGTPVGMEPVEPGCSVGECEECGGHLELVETDDRSGRTVHFAPGPGAFEVTFRRLEHVWSEGVVVVRAATRSQARERARAENVKRWLSVDSETQRVSVDSVEVLE